MLFGRKFAVLVAVLAFLVLIPVTLHATPRKVHVVALGAVKRVPYSKTGDPAGAKTGEDSLKSDLLSSMAPSRNGQPANRTM